METGIGGKCLELLYSLTNAAKCASESLIHKYSLPPPETGLSVKEKIVGNNRRVSRKYNLDFRAACSNIVIDSGKKNVH